jgi:hypothetical protein
MFKIMVVYLHTLNTVIPFKQRNEKIINDQSELPGYYVLGRK